MTYGKAIKIIEKALNEGNAVEIEYHRKWTNSRCFGKVYDVIGYEYDGKNSKAVNLSGDMIDDYSFIIDAVEVM